MQIRLALLVLILFSGQAALAEVITVNSTEDLPDFDLLDGAADADPNTAGNQVTLRAAIQHANATAGADEVVVPAGKYRLKLKGAQEDQGATGDLDITEDLTITGAGSSSTTIDGKKAKDRILEVASGVTATITGLTLSKGQTQKNDGGGGGIRNHGSLTLDDMVFQKCSSKDDAGALDQQGDAMTVTDSVFSKNRAKDDGGAVDVDDGTATFERVSFVKNKAKDEGGALENSAQSVDLINVTFSRNRAKNEGGAVSNEDGGTMNLTNVTFADNKAKEGSAISTQDEGIVPNTTNVLNVLFAKNQKKNRTCAGSLTSLGGNLDFGTSCGFGAGDLSDTDPKLQKLSASSMPVHELKGSSPAIDGGTDPNCPLEDQLGNPRVDIPGVGTAICDIGAVEFQGS